MKRTRLFSGVLAFGIFAVVTATLARSLGWVPISNSLTVGLFLLGVAALVVAADGMGLVPIRKSIGEHKKTYLAAIEVLAFTGTAVFVLVVYLLFISVGKWTNWPPTTDYYDRLARSFLAGHLYVEDRLSPALLALPNPYDPEARLGIPGVQVREPGTIWDMSLFDGKAYTYWGPAPALILSTLRLFFPVVVGDQQLTFLFLFGCFLFEALILIKLWRRFFGSLPWWIVLSSIFFAGFVNPVPWILFHPRIYEAAIAGGQFFLIAGLYSTLIGVDRLRPSVPLLALTGLMWAAAAGSRATLAIPVAFLGLMVLVLMLRGRAYAHASRHRLAGAAAFGGALLAGALLLAWYNWARFGSIFEFGFRYAITMLDQNKNHNLLFLPIYIRPNISLYLFNPPAWDTVFPFVRPVWNEALVSAFNARFHTIYNSEPIVGLIYSSPILLFALLSPALMITDALPRKASEGLDPSAPPVPTTDGLLQWLLLALMGSTLLELLVVFLVFYATPRYFMDATPTLVLLSCVGFWLVYERLRQHPHWRLSLALVVLALIITSVLMGLLIGFASNLPRVKAENPALLNHLRLFFISLARQLGR